MLLSLARKDLYHDSEEKRNHVLDKYKEFIIPEEEADWFGLTLKEAEKKLMQMEEKIEPEPLKFQYVKEFLDQLKCKACTYLGERTCLHNTSFLLQ